jgi:membrane-bound lytic murein transglycosylase A
VFLDVDSPLGRINWLVMAQDTGGAIRGPVRGDLFSGWGPEAADFAGRMAHRGRYWLLLPRQ